MAPAISNVQLRVFAGYCSEAGECSAGGGAGNVGRTSRDQLYRLRKSVVNNRRVGPGIQQRQRVARPRNDHAYVRAFLPQLTSALTGVSVGRR